MTQNLINEVIQEMLPHLNSLQLKKLKEVLSNKLCGKTITDSDVTKQENGNIELMNLFLSAKKIEGCSEKSLHYYEKTIETLFNGVDRNVKDMSTDDIRTYLSNYQATNNSSKVTIDNIRRILSTFFSWLEDEDYILKSPVRRIHKVKTSSCIKETYSDESLERMRDDCANLRDLAMIDIPRL